MIQKFSLVIIICLLSTAVVAPTVVAQESTPTETPTPTEQPADRSDDPANEGEETTEEIDTVVADVTNNVRIVDETWKSEENVVEVVVEADEPTTIVFSNSDRDNWMWQTYRIDEGQTKIVFELTYNSDKYGIAERIGSGGDGITRRSPHSTIVDLPPSEWAYSWGLWAGAILGVVSGIIYKYRVILYNRVNKIESIFEKQWW